MAKQVEVREPRELPPGRHNYGGGLALIVKPSGRRSWSLRIARNGNQRSFGLGAWPEIDLHQARLNALARRDQVEHAGINAVAPRMPTFEQATKEVYQYRRQSLKDPHSADYWLSRMRRYCRSVWDVPCDKVRRADVIDVLRPLLNAKPAQAGKVRTGIREVLASVQAEHEHMHENVAGEAISHKLKMMTVKQPTQHHRSLPWEDATALANALHYGPAAQAVRLVLLTAVRMDEARLAKWDEFDLSAGVWIIPPERVKTNQPHRVPLSTQAIAVVTSCKVRARALDSPYVFASGRKDGAAVSPANLRRVMAATGHDTTLHGLRTTFRTWAADHGIERELAEHALSHRVGSAVERSYQRSDLLDRRATVMQQWADYVLPA